MNRNPAPVSKPSDHFDGARFFNPGVNLDKSLGDLLRWRWTGQRTPWPKHQAIAPTSVPPASARRGEILVTLVGHSTVLVQVEGCNILTDPMFSNRASPFSFVGPQRARAPGIAFDDLPRIDLVLLSHNHYDHLDLPTLLRLRDRGPPVILTGLGNGTLLARHGIGNVIELDWWQACTPARDIDVTYVPAQHWSSRTPFDRRRALWGGHVVETAAGRLFFAGDTGYGPHLKEIGKLFEPDIALLPIGAYEPRWFMSGQHMNPSDAVRAHRDLGANLSLGIHWGTFQLTDEAIDAPLRALVSARQDARIPDDAFLAPEPGTTMVWRRRPLTINAAAHP